MATTGQLSGSRAPGVRGDRSKQGRAMRAQHLSATMGFDSSPPSLPPRQAEPHETLPP